MPQRARSICDGTAAPEALSKLVVSVFLLCKAAICGEVACVFRVPLRSRLLLLGRAVDVTTKSERKGGNQCIYREAKARGGSDN